MITEKGQVVRISGPDAWVSCQSRIECARCAEGKGCGGGVLGRLLGDRLHEIRVPSQWGLSCGDCVTVGISEQALLSAATLVYLVPLLCLFVGALVGAQMGGEVFSIVAGFVSMGAAYLVLRSWILRSGAGRFVRPVIIKSDPMTP